jgi:hypothetical protein
LALNTWIDKHHFPTASYGSLITQVLQHWG